MNSIEKVRIARAKKLKEKSLVNQDHEKRLELIERTQDIIAGHLKDLSEKEVPTVAFIEPSLKELNTQMVNLINLWSTGFQISNIADARPEITIPDEILVKNQLKLPKWLDSPPKKNKELAEAIKANAKILEDIKKAQTDQTPGSFIPTRRVVMLGKKLVYDDTPSSQPSGGGGNSSALTDSQLRASPIPVAVQGDVTITGDVIVDDVGIQNQAGSKINPATEDRQATANTSLSSIDTKLSSQATAANQTTANSSLSTIATNTGNGATAANQTTLNTSIGSTNETAPTTDTNTSGLNGRLQRVSQRLTSLIALLPGSLGQKARAASLAVTLSSEDVTALTPPAAITGFSTSSLQTTGNTSLSNIDTKTPSLGQAVAGSSSPVVLPASQITTLTPQTNALTDTQLRATPVPVSGTVTATGPLTDTQLRATPVPVSGTVATGGLTDTQIRATPLPVSGTVNPTTPSTLLAFTTTVTQAGTRVQLGSNACLAGIVQAPSTNTGKVYVGGSNVSATVFGSELQPGQSAGIAIDNTNKLYVDAATNGDKLAFFGS